MVKWQTHFSQKEAFGDSTSSTHTNSGNTQCTSGEFVEVATKKSINESITQIFE
jgi:hypothetical protein